MDNNQRNARVSMLARGRRKMDPALRYAGGCFGSPHWLQNQGVAILRRWQGEKYPVPFIPQGVGFALRPESDVQSFAGAAYANDTVYYHSIDRVSPAGVVSSSRHEHAQMAVWGGSGNVGPVPNMPVRMARRQVAGPRVLVTWIYNEAGQQATPATFEVFSDGGTGTMNWTTPIGSIAYVEGRNYFGWRSGIIAAGDRQYSVRAKTVGGVYSLAALVGDIHIGGIGSYVPPAGTHGISIQVKTAVPAAPETPGVI